MHFERFQRKISPISNMAFKFHFITEVYLQLAFQAILQQKKNLHFLADRHSG